MGHYHGMMAMMAMMTMEGMEMEKVLIICHSFVEMDVKFHSMRLTMAIKIVMMVQMNSSMTAMEIRLIGSIVMTALKFGSMK